MSLGSHNKNEQLNTYLTECIIFGVSTVPRVLFIQKIHRSKNNNNDKIYFS